MTKEELPIWVTSLSQRLTDKGFSLSVDEPGHFDWIDYQLVGPIEVHAVRDRGTWDVYVIYPSIEDEWLDECGQYSVRAYQLTACLRDRPISPAPDDPARDADYIVVSIDEIVDGRFDVGLRLRLEQVARIRSRMNELTQPDDLLHIDLSFQFQDATDRRNEWDPATRQSLIVSLEEALSVTGEQSGPWHKIGHVYVHSDPMLVLADFDVYAQVQNVMRNLRAPTIFVPTHDQRRYLAEDQALKAMFGPEFQLPNDFAHPFATRDLLKSSN